MSEAESVSLVNLSRGAAVELFDHELKKVLGNVKDVNTDAKAKRKITLEVIFSPYPDRVGIDVAIACTSKLSGVNQVTGGSMFIAVQEGEYRAFSHDLRQEPLFKEEAPAPSNIVPMHQATK